MASEVDKQILDRLKRLPPDRQREVLDFVGFLERKTTPTSGRPTRSLERLPAGGRVSAVVALVDSASGLSLVPIDAAIARALAAVPRPEVPDMPDRIIAATAVHMGVPLVSRDHKIVASCVRTIW